MGNTCQFLQMTRARKDHPHIHGEYGRAPQRKCKAVGSPPHTWGIRVANCLLCALLGITPTYMGNTPTNLKDHRNKGDHPHIHGEYAKGGMKMDLTQGSPPHTWGILAKACRSSLLKGITPTYMGNTHVWLESGMIGRDHPHIHGEYDSMQRIMQPV